MTNLVNSTRILVLFSSRIHQASGTSLRFHVKKVRKKRFREYLLFFRNLVIKLLHDKPCGSFLIRDSNSFANAYGLAVKVDIKDMVRPDSGMKSRLSS